MPTKHRKAARRSKPAAAAQAPATLRALERRVKRLERELAAAHDRHARQLEHVRRAANRRLATMVQEIAALRHHEARAEALERLLETHAAARGTSNGEDPRLPG
jgi:predicted  nucleic acid-binding Zn-ribbon protein